MLGTALALWRGPAFAEARLAPGVAPYALYLEEARLVAIEEWAQARIDRGDHIALSAELATLCGEHPLRERLWELRMLALYRSGRQADALGAYRQLRDHLRDQLGLEPGERLRALELAILHHDAALLPASQRKRSDPASSTPRPVAGAALLVGRDGELTELEVAWALAREHSATPVLIAGEPGIGKSALATAFADRLRRRGVRVLVGRCHPSAQAPYQPFRDALAGLGVGWGESDRRPGLSPDDLVADPETARLELFESVGEVVCDAARERAMVIVIEDLHWADASSLLLACHLGSRLHGEAVLIILTCRDTEVVAGSPLDEALAQLRRGPGATTLRLSGLSESDVLALLAAGARAPVDPEPAALAALLHRATEG
ncbi:MAG: BTAD domain-containing putative transcriptional regulator, partial [Solirubrobacteraceae bacterium]